MENTIIESLIIKAKKNEGGKVLTATILGLIWITAFVASVDLFYVSLALATVFLAAGLFFIIYRVPEAGIHIVIISVMVYERWFGLQPLSFGGGLLKIYPLDITLIFTAFFIFMNLQPNSVKTSKRFLPLYIFFAAVVISSAYSVLHKGDLAIIGSALKNLVFYPLAFFLIIAYCKTRQQWKRIFNSFLVGGVIIIGFILAGILTGQGIWSSFTPLSTGGTRLLSATHAFFLLLPLYLLIVFYIYEKKVFGRYDLFFMLAWIVGLILSLFRNLWLGFGLGLAVIYLLAGRYKRRNLVLLTLKVAAVSLLTILVIYWAAYLFSSNDSAIKPFVTAIKERALALNPFSVEDSSAQYRLAAWKEAWKTYKTHPLMGIGFGKEITFELSGNEYQIAVRELHNDYMAFLLQTGIIGLGAFMILAVAIIVQGIKAVRDSSSELKPYLTALSAFIVTFFLLSAMGTYWETNFFLVFFWIAAGLVYRARNLSADNNTQIYNE